MKKTFVLTALIFLCFVCIIGSRFLYVKIKYPTIVSDIEFNRIRLLNSYKSADSINDKKEVIDQAKTYLHEVLQNNIFPSWLGTPWSFYGDAEFPFQGSIACGSFVEKVLKHTGFRVDNRLSSQPSEYIIRNMISGDNIKRFSNIPIHIFNDEINNLGEGIYIVGLDNHVGFLYLLEGKYRFIHSHGYLFVLSELPSLSPILRRSKYRVVGKLFDANMIEHWLYGKNFPLKFNYFKS
jgi:hypothetical protein